MGIDRGDLRSGIGARSTDRHHVPLVIVRLSRVESRRKRLHLERQLCDRSESDRHHSTHHSHSLHPTPQLNMGAASSKQASSKPAAAEDDKQAHPLQVSHPPPPPLFRKAPNTWSDLLRSPCLSSGGRFSTPLTAAISKRQLTSQMPTAK